MLSFGLPSLTSETSETVDSVKFINNVYHLVRRLSSADALFHKLSDRQDHIVALTVFLTV